MNKRLKYLREEILLLSQDEFASRIERQHDIISIYENGKKPISKKFIKLVCDEYNINQEWLETGEGPIFRKMTEKEEIIFKINKALEGRSESLIHGLYFLTELDAEEIKLLENIAYQIIEHTRSREYIKRINEKK